MKEARRGWLDEVVGSTIPDGLRRLTWSLLSAVLIVAALTLAAATTFAGAAASKVKVTSGMFHGAPWALRAQDSKDGSWCITLTLRGTPTSTCDKLDLSNTQRSIGYFGHPGPPTGSGLLGRADHVKGEARRAQLHGRTARQRSDDPRTARSCSTGELLRVPHPMSNRAAETHRGDGRPSTRRCCGEHISSARRSARLLKRVIPEYWRSRAIPRRSGDRACLACQPTKA